MSFATYGAMLIAAYLNTGIDDISVHFHSVILRC